MSFDITEFSAWAVWVLPLIACLFVPVIAKKGDKIRNYFVIGIMAAVAGLAFSLIPGSLVRQRQSNNLHASVDSTD